MNIFKVGRIANAIVGTWLFLSAVLIPRTVQSAMNVAIIGALTATISLVSLYRLPILRFLNIPLAIWLFVTLWRPGYTSLGVVNDMLVSTLLFGFAAIPTDLEPGEVPLHRLHAHA